MAIGRLSCIDLNSLLDPADACQTVAIVVSQPDQVDSRGPAKRRRRRAERIENDLNSMLPIVRRRNLANITVAICS